MDNHIKVPVDLKKEDILALDIATHTDTTQPTDRARGISLKRNLTIGNNTLISEPHY